MDARSRQSAAIAMSAALHAGILALLVGRGAVRLEVAPRAVVVDLVEAAVRTAGPGRLAEELRQAALPPAPPPAPKAPPRPAEAPPPPEPRRRVPAKSAPKAAPPAADPAVAPAPTSSPAAVAAASPELSGSVGGRDAVSTAPAWAPTARVRYEELLFAWMERHKQYPMLARRRGLEGAGVVRVRIGRDGRVLEDAIVRSTGDAMLDQATLDMVRRANPFPKVPSEYDGESFEFVAPIEYRLR